MIRTVFAVGDEKQSIFSFQGAAPREFAARRGELKNFTGIDSPYEAPATPELRVDTSTMSAEQAAGLVIAHLRQRGLIAGP